MLRDIVETEKLKMGLKAACGVPSACTEKNSNLNKNLIGFSLFNSLFGNIDKHN